MYDRSKSESVDGQGQASPSAQAGRRDRAPRRTARLTDEETAMVIHQIAEDSHSVREQIEYITDLVVERALHRLAELHKLETTPTRLVSIPEAATMLCRSVDAVYRMIQRGKIHAVRQPGGRRLDIEYREIRRYIDRGRGGKLPQEGIV